MKVETMNEGIRTRRDMREAARRKYIEQKDERLKRQP
jgi:hypothetical protein